MLAPYWAKGVGKNEFRALQASRCGGGMICRLTGDRTELEGSCVFYLEGEVEYKGNDGLLESNRCNQITPTTPLGTGVRSCECNREVSPGCTAGLNRDQWSG
jgi:hypothetical protein